MRYLISFIFLLSFSLLIAQPNPVSINISEESAEPGETISIDFTVENFQNVVTIQFAINYDQNLLDYQGLDNFGLPEMSESNNFGVPPEIEQGKINFSWYDSDTEGESIDDGDKIFTIRFFVKETNGFAEISINESNSANPVLEISESNGNVLPVEVTNGGIQIGAVSVNNIDLDLKVGEFTPNILTERSTLKIQSPRKSEIFINLYTVSGQLINNYQLELETGENYFELDKHDLPNIAGSYYIELVSGDAKIVRKIMRL